MPPRYQLPFFGRRFGDLHIVNERAAARAEAQCERDGHYDDEGACVVCGRPDPDFYAEPENQTPQGPPVRRRKRP